MDVSKTPMTAIKKLRSYDDVIWGQSYFIIDKEKNRLFRTIHPSSKKDYYTLKIDRQLTPNEFKWKPVAQEIAVADILGILSIVAEIRSF
jgi:hypothetical protein